VDRSAFRGFHEYLRHTWPAADATLERERVSSWSLLYTWRGLDPQLDPILLAAHYDVVPVDAERLGAWDRPPFEGAIEDGVVWGRGAIDDKGSVVCILDAVDRLVREGFQPARTVYLAFGHDEEIGGPEGALAMAKLLESRGVRLGLVLDEGGIIAEGMMPGVDAAVAVIGIAEKGSVSIALDVEDEGGHSSTPPRHTAVGRLARAVVALEDEPMPVHRGGVSGGVLDAVAPEMPFGPRLVLANRWLFAPALEVFFARIPALDAMFRTTTAVTIIEGGVKENVLPSRARAVANFRIHPEDSVDAVVAHVRRVVGPDVKLQVGVRSEPREPSPISPTEGEAYAVVARSVRSVHPGAVVAPYLVLGGTDARHYHRISENVYRFLPFELGPEATTLPHGTNERISIDNLVRAVRFYTRLIREAAGNAQSSSE
jgi:carboxypeptidase PM20D1